jgi:formylmethanofuran dehydrogenase subunit A
VAQYSREHLALDFRNAAISHDELCSCCNGGRLLKTGCFASYTG